MSQVQHSIALPDLLRDALERGGVRAVTAWWGDLDPGSRCAILELWSDCGHQHFGSDRQTDFEMDMRVVGTPADPDSDTFDGFWNHDFYDYLVNHEAYYFEEIKFHVCTAAASARSSIEAGLISSDFVCSRDERHCPMMRRLAEFSGRSIRLSLTFAPRSRTEPTTHHQ